MSYKYTIPKIKNDANKLFNLGKNKMSNISNEFTVKHLLLL
jgi:hypothetical protein